MRGLTIWLAGIAAIVLAAAGWSIGALAAWAMMLVAMFGPRKQP